MQPRMQGHLQSGGFLVKLFTFADYLGQFSVSFPKRQSDDGELILLAQTRKEPNSQNYWQSFVDRFFSQTGVLRTQLWCASDQSTKKYEIANPVLARYYWTHFESGFQNIQMTLEQIVEKDLPNGGHFVECSRCTFFNWMKDGHVVRLTLSTLSVMY